jgi:hypothetical protein
MMAALAVATLGCTQRDNERSRASAPRRAAIQKPADSTLSNEGEATFIATVTSINLLPKSDPYFRFVVNLKIDKVVSGPSPGNDFWFAIHSPSQERVNEGQQYRITAKKTQVNPTAFSGPSGVDGWILISHKRLD